MLVPKANGKDYRVVVDYTVLNKFIVDEENPLPRIRDLLSRFGKHVYSSHFDLTGFYNQFRVADAVQHYLTFSLLDGYYTYIGLPMGIKTTGVHAQREITKLLLPIKTAFAYLDDIAIVG